MPKGERYRIEASAEDEVRLRMWAASRKGERRLAERAQAILLSAAAETVATISARTGLSAQAASKWRRRYLEAGLDGLLELPRSGRPPQITPQC